MLLRLAPFIVVLLLASCDRDALPVGGNGGPPTDLAVVDHAGADLATSCLGLDVATCRATAACRVAWCLQCSCTPATVCIGRHEPGPSCPATGCPRPLCCQSQGDCPMGGVHLACLAPGQSPGCGPCIVGSSCSRDADCAPLGPNQICISSPCACTPNQMICQQGCGETADCRDPALECQQHRCLPKACRADADCPRHYHCFIGGVDGQRCVRDACNTDGDCGDGFCVDGACYDSLGICTPLTL
jgi:hypothetical protein